MKTNNNSITQKLYTTLHNKKVLLTSFGATVIFTLILTRMEHAFSGNSGAGYFAIQLSFSRQAFEMVLASWGSEGISIFLKSLWIDLIYIVSYTTLFLSAPVFFHNLKNQKNSTNEHYNTKLFIIPLIGASFELIENLLLNIIITQRLFTDELIFVSSIASSIKFLMFVSCLGIILMKYFEMRKS